MASSVLVGLCLILQFLLSQAAWGDDARKIFGGYRITPRICKPTRKSHQSLPGENICMFNEECKRRNGELVGACMDGFMVGVCCHLSSTSTHSAPLSYMSTSSSTAPTSLSTYQGGSQNLFHVNDELYSASGITHTAIPETIILTNDNHLHPEFHFQPETTQAVPYSPPLVHVSLSTPGLSAPQKPSDSDKYVLVPTITHPPKPPPPKSSTEIESIVTILQQLNATTPKPSSSSAPPTKRKPTRKPTRRRPVPVKSTIANSPSAFTSSPKPPSTSYVYSSMPTVRPPSTLSTHIAGPTFSVASSPTSPSQYIPSPAPTVIVLNPTSDYQTAPSSPAAPPPYRKPGGVNSVSITNHVIQNIYSGSSERPSTSPTIVITPKPSTAPPLSPPDDIDDTVEVGVITDDLNFPPVRNPNFNMSNVILQENDIGFDDATTPQFIEDEALNKKVASFVNHIISDLQPTFADLKDVVYNRNRTRPTEASTLDVTTTKPLRKQGTTSKTTTKRPPSRRPTASTPTRRTARPTRRPITTTTTTKPTTSNIPLISDNEVLSSGAQEDDTSSRFLCGVRPLLRNGRIVGGKGAVFGEFPWQALIRESTWLGLFTKNKCGGVLIGAKYVLTAAHCQPGFLASLVAVLGEFDTSGELETRRAVTRNVKRVIVHREYDAGTFANDLAVLELESPVTFDEHIVPICLPRAEEDFTGRMATVTGWGRLKYGGGVPTVLHEVQVPIMENHVCQEMYVTAGHPKIILDSFLCAGYANGQKDSCEGDSGGPLVLQREDGRYQLAGTVSHGIKCAAPYLPGVYMRTTYYRPWLESVTGIRQNRN